MYFPKLGLYMCTILRAKQFWQFIRSRLRVDSLHLVGHVMQNCRVFPFNYILTSQH
jgi:hypothetical protein